MAKNASMTLKNLDTGETETVNFKFTLSGIKKVSKFLKGNYRLLSVEGSKEFKDYMTNEIESYQKAPEDYKLENPYPVIAKVTGQKVADIKKKLSIFKRKGKQ